MPDLNERPSQLYQTIRKITEVISMSDILNTQCIPKPHDRAHLLY